MRVVQLTTSFQLWGTERVVLGLSRGLKRRGIDVRVGAIRGGDAELGERLRADGIPCFSVASPGQTLEGWWRLARWVRKQDADVVHGHLWSASILSALARPGGAGLVWSHHNMDSRIRGMRGWPYRHYWSRVDAHTFVTDAARAYHEEVVARPARRVAVIPNGTNVDDFRTVHPRPGPVIGSLGRLIPGKGFGVLIDAAARLIEESPTLRLRIAGSGPAASSLRERIRSRGLEDHVDMVPKVADVSGFLGSLNVFVMPSRREGFGMTMLEALAAGLPVVASDLPVLREVGGEVVRWAAPGDPASLAQALRTIPEDAWSDDAVAARRERAEIFSVDRMVEAYLALYAEILDRRARRAG